MDERLLKLLNINDLKNKNVLLVGVGGVGSFCFEALIRSGIKNITIVDFDDYELSNLNRQLHANLNTIGQSKVDVLKEYASTIDPSINVTAINKKVDSNFVLDQKFDYIIDACDTVEAKVCLAKLAMDSNTLFISSCGIGNRLEPGKLKRMRLDKVYGDPLAKKYRNSLRKMNLCDKIDVIASIELPIKEKTIASYMPVTAYAGLLLADAVIKDLITNENRRNTK